jgi:hypothetical protein
VTLWWKNNSVLVGSAVTTVGVGPDALVHLTVYTDLNGAIREIQKQTSINDVR